MYLMADAEGRKQLPLIFVSWIVEYIAKILWAC